MGLRTGLTKQFLAVLTAMATSFAIKLALSPAASTMSTP